MSTRQAQKERAAEEKKQTKKKSETLVNTGEMCRAKALQQLDAAEGIAGDHVSDADVNSVPSSASAMNNSPLNVKSKYLQNALLGIFDNFMNRIEERTSMGGAQTYGARACKISISKENMIIYECHIRE